jgi:hypothetical protein
MDPDLSAVILQELIKTLFSGALLAVGWFLGRNIVASWDIRRKRQEIDVATAVQFQQLYGELKEVARLWRDVNKEDAAGLAPPSGYRWQLLANAIQAESKYEAVVIKLASERVLTIDERRTLGLFRQACQELRVSIRRANKVSWSNLGPEYLLFNDLAADVTTLLARMGSGKNVSAEIARTNLRDVSKVRYEDWVHEVSRQTVTYQGQLASYRDAPADMRLN